jgi:hypothetical protein
MDNLAIRKAIEIMKDRIDDQDRAIMKLIGGFQKELDAVKKNRTTGYRERKASI